MIKEARILSEWYVGKRDFESIIIGLALAVPWMNAVMDIALHAMLAYRI